MKRIYFSFFLIILFGCGTSTEITNVPSSIPTGIVDFNDHDTSGVILSLDFATETISQLPIKGFGPERTPQNTILSSYGQMGGTFESDINGTQVNQPLIPGYNSRLSPDGKVVAAEGSNQFLFVSERTSGKILFRSDSVFKNASSPSWTPDGKVLFFGSRNSLVGLFMLSFESNSFSYVGPGGLHPNVSIDGSKICYVKNYSQIYTANIDGSNEKQLTDSSARYAHPKWSPDGKWIATFVLSDNPKVTPDRLLFIRVDDHLTLDARKYFPTESFDNLLYQISWR